MPVFHLGTGEVLEGWGPRDGGGDNLHGMNPHTGCLLKDGVGYFFWNLKQEVGTWQFPFIDD